MRKSKRLILCGAAAMAVLAGGSNTKTASTTAAETASEAVSETETTGSGTTEATTPEEEEILKGSVVLGEYVGMEYTPMDTTVTDEDVEATIQNVLAMNASYVEVNRAAADGDMVNIDYVGKKDGVAFDGGTAEGSDLLLGSGRLIDGFEDGLIGAKKGDSVTLNLTFPESYHSEELAGQEVTFDVTVNAVKEEQKAVLNDDFVKSLELESGATTTEEYRKGIRDSLEENNESIAKMQMENDVLEAVIANCEFSDIDARIEKEYGEQWEQMNNMAAMYGMDMEFYASMNGMSSVEEFQEAFKEQVSNTIKVELVMDAIAEKENLTLSEEDYAVLAKEFGIEDISSLTESYTQEMVDQAALQIKVLNFLTSNAVAK